MAIFTSYEESGFGGSIPFPVVLTSGDMTGNAKIERHCGAHRISRQVFEFGHVSIGNGDEIGDDTEAARSTFGLLEQKPFITSA